MKYVFLDFEFNGTAEKDLNLVSCAYSVGTIKEPNQIEGAYWLYKDEEAQRNLRDELQGFADKSYTFVAYAVTAEARSMLTLGMDVIGLSFIDLYLEYRCLTNHYHEWMYGKQLTKEGKKVFTTAPKNKHYRDEEEDDDANSSKPSHGYASACYKALGVLVDTDRKNKVRDIIIKDDNLEEYRGEILEYNISDIEYLPKLLKVFVGEYKERLHVPGFRNFDRKQLGAEMRVRGNYAARTAVMESLGYPIDFPSTRAFSDNVYGILRSTQKEINELFPKILPFTRKSNFDYSWSHVRTREWIKNCPHYTGWKITDKGAISLSLDAFKKYYPFKHDYPRDNFGAQMVRYLTLKRNLNGFTQSAAAKKKRNFWDSVGSDNRVRPYFGIYGAQSARSQPSATGFLFLKSAWMRVLCSPRKGKAIGAIDYKSQEFLLAALISGDEDMLAAYESGDVYLYFAKLAGAVPWDGKKEDYPEERKLFKQVTLSLSYGKGYKSLAIDLTESMGKKYTENDAKNLINKFNKAYNRYFKSKKKVLRKYKEDGFIKIPDGWYMWGDNANDKSVLNVPIQGLGSAIMRKAVCYAQDAGLKVIKTLHDAIYIEYDAGDLEAMTKLAEAMDKGFRYYFDGPLKDKANVGLDGNTWGPDYKDEYKEIEGLGEVKFQNLYIDERSEAQYEFFKKYFHKEEDYEI